MTLQLNREFAQRHLGVAVLFLGLCGWFAYDGLIGYPRMDRETFKEKILHGKQGDFETLKNQAIARQYQFAGLCALAAIIIAAGVLRCKRQTLAWDDAQMNGTLTGGRPLAFADVERLDEGKWKSKNILKVHAKDGRVVTLDAWHHTGVQELAARLGADAL